VTNTLVTKGETVASSADAVKTTDSGQDTNTFTVSHTKDASATGWVVYMCLDGTNVWYRAADGTTSTIVVVDPPTSDLIAELPTRNECLVSQVSAILSAWQTAVDATIGLYDVEVVTCAGGFEHSDPTPSRADNILLMKKFSDHAEFMYGETYKKRIAVCPAIEGETHAQRVDTTSYTNVSERLVKVAFNGTEGYYTLDACDPLETYQGGNSYPLSKSERDAEYALGWGIVKPFEGTVRIMKGVTAQCGATSPTVFRELFVRTVIDEIIEQIERHGDSFIGSGVAVNTQASRMILQADIDSAMKSILEHGSIAAYSVIVVQNAEDNPNAVDVAFSVTVSHEINQIFGYITIGG
jgi:hypothetical protein